MPQLKQESIVVFVMSALLMCLELLEVRTMAFTHWFHFVYFVIVLALIGFAIAGTILSVEKRLKDIDKRIFYPVCFLGFSVAAFLSVGFSLTTPTNVGAIQVALSEGGAMGSGAIQKYLPLLCLLMLPFLFASLLICRSLMVAGKHSKTIYGWNLVGTALGSLAFVMLVSPLGAPRLLYSLIAIAMVASLYMKPRSLFLRSASALTLVGAVCGVLIPSIYFTPTIDQSKNLAGFYPHKLVETRWSPLFRVDMAKTHYGRLITIDGDAQTWVYRIPPEAIDEKEIFVPDSKKVSRHLVFQSVPEENRNRALVIGAGGGMDVFAAKQAGYKKIDAVDIDSTRLEWLKGKHSSLLSGLMNHPSISTHAMDGRNFVLSKSNLYDAIMLYNVDSLTAMTTGAYNLSENYLYTVEAFNDYYEALSDNGVFQITRPNWGSKREILRVMATMYEVVRLNGISPERRVAVFSNNSQIDFVFSKGGFTKQRLSQVLETLRLNNTVNYRILFSDLFVESSDPALVSLFESALIQDKSHLEATFGNFKPVVDDRPFFFEYRNWSNLLVNPMQFVTAVTSNSWGSLVLGICILMATGVVAFLIIYGLVGMQERPSLSGGIFAISMFTLIGVGYMLVQLSLIQRFTLVVGNPILSMATIIPTLLGAMGVSSLFLVERLQKAPKYIPYAVWGSLMIIATYLLLFYQAPLYSIAGHGTLLRVGITIVCLIPLGLALGLFFPLSIGLLTGQDSNAIPIAWTANGGASVLGSLAGVLLALIFGFQIVYFIAIGFYCLASIVLMSGHTFRQRSGSAL